MEEVWLKDCVDRKYHKSIGENDVEGEYDFDDIDQDISCLTRFTCKIASNQWIY